MSKIKDVTIGLLFLAVLILLLLRQCTPPQQVVKVLEIKHDTIRTIDIDTLFPDPKIITKYVNIGNPTTSTSALHPITCDKVNTYYDSLVDSNITITNELLVLGELKMNVISYQLHVPFRITKTITNEVTNTITKEVYRMPCYSAYGGLGIGGNKSQLSAIMPYIGIRAKKTYVDAGYNLVDQTYNLRVGINLFNIK